MLNQFLNFWHHLPEHITPYIIQIGQFQVRYYGLMYILAFLIVYLLVMHRIKRENYSYSKDIIQSYFIWGILGIMIGGRLGYVIFYNPKYYISHPLEIFLPFSLTDGFHFTGIAGMSYHGGLIGVILTGILFCHRNKINFWKFADFFIPAIPLGYTFGRLGNFINGELYGRVTTMPWGMYFPQDVTRQLRHPSQLYEAFFEGIFLFLILWNLRKKKVFDGFLFSLYLIGYGIVRFFIEFVREPDPQIGLIFGFFTLGQIFCLGMMLGGASIFYARKKLGG